ncbi:uncharacterized protein LOC143010751 isoform X2 [Genypterus blacodes]|uniref:uncharacterized protein LOC143010751 isoform X2 n=1 Tax=Genypterus blacodes TaxID=154954 RepID=UPI003F76B0F6
MTDFPLITEQQEVNCHRVRVKEEEEPMEVDTLLTSDLINRGPVTEEKTPSPPKTVSHHLFSMKTDDQGLSGNKMANQLHPRAKMADQCLIGLKVEDKFCTGGCQPVSKMANNVVVPRTNMTNKGQFKVKMEGQGACGAKMVEQGHSRGKMEDQFHSRIKMKGQLPSRVKMEGQLLSRVNMEDQLLSTIKMEDQLLSIAKIEDQLPSRIKMEDQLLSRVKIEDQLSSRIKMEDQLPTKTKVEDQLLSGVKMEDRFFSGSKMEDQLFSRTKIEEQLLFGVKMEDQLTSGAKMADHCLRAVLWQDMSVNLASTLLHQLSERVNRSNSQQVDRMTPPTRSSPALKVDVDHPCSSPHLGTQDPLCDARRSPSSDQTTACSYFYRCHVCGFETEGRGLFHSHMAEHRQWEHSSFSLHCCVCDHSTNQEAEMCAHIDTHTPGDPRASVTEIRCPIAPPATTSSTPSVAIATQLQKSTSEHRCRICQRSFPGQQELLVHFQGHRQGNQYRCDRCGHLTRTANKLVEHVRVHTGERPFTCDLCPYSAKRRDSLRLHCKVKHPAYVHGNKVDTPSDVHTHRSYVQGDNQRSYKHGNLQRLHTPLNTHTAVLSTSSPFPLLHPSLSDRAGWRDLSPLLPITTLITLKPHSPSSPSSSSSSSSLSVKNSFLSYLGLTGSS